MTIEVNTKFLPPLDTCNLSIDKLQSYFDKPLGEFVDFLKPDLSAIACERLDILY